MDIRKKTYSSSSRSRVISLAFAVVATVCVIVEIILLINYFKSNSLKNKRYSTYLLEYEKVEIADEEIDDLKAQLESLTSEVSDLEQQVSEIDTPSQ